MHARVVLRAASLRRVTLGTLLASAAAIATAQAPPQTDAESGRAKLELVIETGQDPRTEDAPAVRTSFSVGEINAYLHVYGPEFLPDGITGPEVGIGDQGQVGVRGIVDLDAVRNSRERGLFDPLAYLTGSLEVLASGVVTTANGRGMAQLESATVGGVSVPKRLLQEIVRFYTTTDERPDGFDIDAPFELPANILSIVFERGSATTIQ